MATPEFQGYPPDSIDWNAKGDFITISYRNYEDPTVLIISAESQRVVTQLNVHAPVSVRWHPEEDIVVSVNFFEAIIWDAVTGEQLVIINKLEPPDSEAVSFSHLYAVCWLNNDVIAVVGYYDIFLVRVSDQTTLKALGNLGTVAVDCHRDEKLATTSGLVFDFDIGLRFGTDSHLATLDDYTFEYVSVAWSPDGSIIVANGNGGMCRFGVFDGETSEIIAELPGSFSRVHDYLRYADSIAWHPDGSRFATVGQFDIRLWDAETLTMLKRFDGFDVPFYPASWDEDWRKAERLEHLHRYHTKCPQS